MHPNWKTPGIAGLIFAIFKGRSLGERGTGGANRRLWKLLTEHFALPPVAMVHAATNPQLA